MNHTFFIALCVRLCIPRVSGDEPVIDHELIAGEQYSPRERG